MATPNIGTSISEGYSRGLDRVGPWLPSLAVVAVVAGIVAGAVAQAQDALIPNADDIFRAVIEGKAVDQGDLRTYGLIGAVGTAIQMLIGYAAYTLYGGILHRERHGETVESPTPGSVLPRLGTALGHISPKVFVLVGLLVGVQLLQALLGTIGGVLSIVLVAFLLVLSVRWLYATVIAGSGEAIAGSGEATGDAAYERSAGVVAGSWWGTLGTFIVIGLATVVPVAIGGAIVGGILPGTFLSAFGSTAIGILFGVPLFSAALESAWAQVEGDAHGGDGHTHTAFEAPRAEPPAGEPPAAQGPFV